MEFNRYLKTLLDGKGLSPTEAARKIDRSPAYVFQLLSGSKKPPHPEFMGKMADAWKCSEEEIDALMKFAFKRVLRGKSLEDFYEDISEDVKKEHSKHLHSVREKSSPYGSKEDLVPLLGSAPAGIKNFTNDEVEEMIPFSKKFTRGRRFYLLRVRGDSMIGVGIRDGDIVIVDADAMPEKGDAVVVLVDHECTIKKFFQYGETVVLEPANPKYERQEYNSANEIKLRGVVRGVLWKGLIH